MILKMLVNRKYGTKFIYNNGILTTLDGKTLIYHPETKHVIVPDGIEIIGNWAFISFDKMNKIDLPNSLKEIGDYSFKFVDNLKELTIPDSVEKLGEGSFCYSNIDSIKVSDKIETFPACCFRYCKIDKLPSALKTIEDDNCFEFENENDVIEFPYGFEHLGSYSIGYIFEEVRFPATTKYIAEDFWYDSLVGPDERDDKPQIIIDSDNPYFSVDENNNLIYKCVADIETTRLFSRRAISFVESETERNYLLEKDVLLSPKDIINLVEMSPEYPENLRTWFYWDLAQTTILTEQERLMLSYIREKTNSVRDELHSFFKNRRLVAFGISSDGQETVLGKYSHSLSCTDDIEKMQDLEKYDKIIAKQYKVSDKNLKNELGRFEIDKDNYCINNIYYFEDYPIPQNIQNLIDAYIDLPHPFEAGDIVKTKRNEQFVVSEVITPTKEQIESKYVDSSDMAVTVLPIEYSERVRECLRNGDKIPEELFNEHQHLCFLSLEMVEKFCS